MLAADWYSQVNADTEDHRPQDEKKSRLRTHMYPHDVVKISVLLA